MNYYERHLGDYARDTAHLSLLEHGAYTLLLDRYYATEKPIPADQAHRVARARTKDEKAAVDAVLAEFFVREGGAYRNKRADRVIAEYQEAEPDREAKRENGKERVRRHRERRRQLFDDLRSAGIVPDYDTPTAELERMAKRVTTQDVTDPVTRYDTANQSQTPYPTITPDSPTQPTRDARTPADEPDLVGQFEGHDDPKPAAPNPATPLAVALNRAGFRCTAMNPDLVAYAQTGGTAEHLTAVAAHPDCAGKSATYVVRFARRELTDQAKPITPTARAGPNGTTPPTSKSVQALQALEALKSHDSLAPDRNRDRPAEAAPALARPHAVR